MSVNNDHDMRSVCPECGDDIDGMTPEQLAATKELVKQLEERRAMIRQLQTSVHGLKPQADKAVKQLAALKHAFLPDEVRAAILVQGLQTSLICEILGSVVLYGVESLLGQQVQTLREDLEAQELLQVNPKSKAN